MRSRVKVRLNLRGLNRVMASAPVQGELDSLGSDMAADAGDGFEYVPSSHRWTARGYVQVNSVEGARRQADDAILERVLAGRGGLRLYTTRAGKQRWATQAQIDNWTRGRS